MEIDNVAESLVDTLVNAKVGRLYALVGDSLNAVSDAMRRSGKLDLVHVRHEESAAFAASAQGQLTDSVAACAGTSGPGAIHLLNGLLDAHRSHSPVFALASDIPSTEAGTDYFQDSHTLEVFRTCSCYCEPVANGAQVPRVFQIALQKASADKDVATVVLPGDVCIQGVGAKSMRHGVFRAGEVETPEPSDITELVDAINSASRITLFCGDGCRYSAEKLERFAEKICAPIVYTLRGKQWVGYLPHAVGMTGLLGFGGAVDAISKCDLLIILGADFPYKQWLPSDRKGVKIAQIDRVGGNLGKRCRLDIGITGDVSKTLSMIEPAVKSKSDTTHFESAVAALKKSRGFLDIYAKHIKCEKIPHPVAVETFIDKYASDDAIFTVPTGLGTVWAAHYLRPMPERRIIGSFTHGSMACELPMAIGAQMTYPNRQLVALCGDGGFSMLMGELLTVAQYNMPIKMFVFNNSTLGFIDLEMLAAGYPPYGTSMKNPNFADVAQACGIKGIRIDDGCKLEEGIKRAFAEPGPVLVDIATDPHAISIPPKISIEQAYKFSLGIGKLMLSGGVESALKLYGANEKLIWGS